MTEGFPCSKCKAEAPPHDHTCPLVSLPVMDEWTERCLSRGRGTRLLTTRLNEGFRLNQDDEDLRDIGQLDRRIKRLDTTKRWSR